MTREDDSYTDSTQIEVPDNLPIAELEHDMSTGLAVMQSKSDRCCFVRLSTSDEDALSCFEFFSSSPIDLGEVTICSLMTADALEIRLFLFLFSFLS